jgi:hypothetical protein
MISVTQYIVVEHWLEILFGGVGGSAILAAIGWFFNKRRRDSDRVSLSGTGELTSPPDQERPVMEEESFGLTPHSVARALKRAAPFSRPNIAATFEGAEVRWRLHIRQVLPNSDVNTVHVVLETDKATVPFVCTNVEIARFPFLKFVHEQTLLLVTGRIGRATEHEIFVVDADLTLLEPRLAESE